MQVLPDALFAHAAISLDIEQEVYDQQGKATMQMQTWAKDHDLTSVNHHWFKGARLVVADNPSL
jgi:hypothetical protein